MYKVMLVDDEEIVCSGLKQFIPWEEYGFEVVHAASSAAQALFYMETQRVDVVISDIRMPVQDGLQLLQVIQEEYPDVNSIILTGYGEFEYARKALRYGAVDFLTKPVNFSELKQLLSSIHAKLEKERKEVWQKQEYQNMKISFLLNSLTKGDPEGLFSAQALACGLPDEPFVVIRMLPLRNHTDSNMLQIREYMMHHPCNGSVTDSGTFYSFHHELFEVAVLLYPERQLKISEDVADSLFQSLSFSKSDFAVGISSLCKSLADLGTAYQEAGASLQYSLINPGEKVACYRDIRHSPLSEFKVDKAFATELMNMASEPEQRKNMAYAVNSKVDLLHRQDGQSLEEIQAFYIQILMMISRHVQNFRLEDEPVDIPYEWIHTLLMTKDLEALKGSFEQQISGLLERLDHHDHHADHSSVIKKVQRYIQEHYAEDISLNTLSGIFFVHPTYLSRLFKEKTGINFIDYLTEIRIARSKAFLHDPSLKIYDISEMVGYDSPRYFSKLFRNIVGISPKEYREQQLCKNPGAN